jgi:hypothetical protein
VRRAFISLLTAGCDSAPGATGSALLDPDLRLDPTNTCTRRRHSATVSPWRWARIFIPSYCSGFYEGRRWRTVAWHGNQQSAQRDLDLCKQAKAGVDAPPLSTTSPGAGCVKPTLDSGRESLRDDVFEGHYL